MKRKTKGKLDCKELNTGLRMNEHTLDAIVSPGHYLVQTCNAAIEEGFPATVSKGYISAFLEVSVTNCSNERLATRTIGQILTVTDANGVAGIYTRNRYNKDNKDIWTPWNAANNNQISTKCTDFIIVDTPARLKNHEKLSTGFGGYSYDLSQAYLHGYRIVRFRGANYTLDNDIVRGLTVDNVGNVENYITTTTEKTNGWVELPITENTSYLKASYVKQDPALYGEVFTPEYIDLVETSNTGPNKELENRISVIEDVLKGVDPMSSFNIINPNELLNGYSLSSGEIITNSKGIFSNKLYLEVGKTYIFKGISLYSNIPLGNAAAAIFVAKYDSNNTYLGRDASDIKEVVDGYAFAKYTPSENVAYYRVLLQSGSNAVYPFDATKAMIYEGDYEVKEFIPYGEMLSFPIDKIHNARITNLENAVFGGTLVNTETTGGILLTGASFAYSGNSWFEKVCNELGVTGYNKASSGESIKDTAVKMMNGTLYTATEFENFDILMIMHVHNQNVCDEENLQEIYTDYEVSTSMSYSQAYDYVLKKYAAECYAAKDDSSSKWYGTKYGKPCRVVCLTHWHDARTIFNDSIRKLKDKWGFELIELDKAIGFSKNQVHPVTRTQTSLLYAQDTEIIDGVTYGWHPTRSAGAYIQDRIAEILTSYLY